MDDGRPVHLGRLPAEGPELRRLDGLPHRRAVVATREVRGTPWVDTRAELGDIKRRLSSSRRSSLRRNGRRAAEAGGAAFDVASPGPGGVDEAFETFVAVEHRSWKGPAGTSLQADEARRAFYRSYVGVAAAAGELRVSTLAIGGRPAAVQLAVEQGGRLWVLKLGVDEAWARCGPGMLLTLEDPSVVHRAAARRLRAPGPRGALDPGVDRPVDPPPGGRRRHRRRRPPRHRHGEAPRPRLRPRARHVAGRPRPSPRRRDPPRLDAAGHRRTHAGAAPRAPRRRPRTGVDRCRPLATRRPRPRARPRRGGPVGAGREGPVEPSAVLGQMIEAGQMPSELPSVHDVRFVDLPTGHWPMFSRPADLADVLVAEILAP